VVSTDAGAKFRILGLRKSSKFGIASQLRFAYLVWICLFYGGLFGTDLMPWTQIDLLFYPRFETLFQHYNHINTSSGLKARRARDYFFTLGFYGCYDEWCAEIEATCASTKNREFGLDNFRITGKYRLNNDIIGDQISLMLGATCERATKIAVRDISSFHHGRNALQLHLSAGKERTCYDTWLSRWWTVTTLAIADHGSPWWRAMFIWEKNSRDTLFLRCFVHTLFGMGNESLNLDDSFRGYGSIHHGSVDIGARLTKITTHNGIWYIEYARRVWAQNFPEQVNLLKISLIYPFSL